ncbi:5'-methylthioadenosine/S-adenosylhomocysteine nucleosidase [Polaromonas sp. JS666]|uniref:5'-methylthioadenosine/S-adenosylhomocysteine nucleosidase n=1 Tax=Polaromonas sp. (strain JS666 / ATCC BAA-500) TaxID=296591 RepID=UPI00089270BF|nr:5'-methylthioadenosine/S-adenosylhomocysteine nucleosidase [Polaromonas sp. JS666]SDM39675.1 adenosylhomocysteine nucleosidase [Polaromonas sp. JS666]
MHVLVCLRRMLPSRLAAFAVAGLLALSLAGCATAPATGTPVRLDETPRIAVISAFEPELTLLLRQLQTPARHRVNGVEFSTGTLQGKPVVLFLSGISMVNASMNTQLVLDRFNIQAIVFSGIAGGVDPSLHIGDVSVPAQWGQYLEVLMARETAPGRYTIPPRMEAQTLAPFGMLHPRPVETRTAASPAPVRKFWFTVDPRMLETARGLGPIALQSCNAGVCLTHKPQLRVGGNGVSGQAFVDNAAFREYAFKTFGANVLDMETAAVGMVAYSNNVPYIAFRSLSDLAGGGEGANEMVTFMNIAADNSAKVLLAFLAAWK